MYWHQDNLTLHFLLTLVYGDGDSKDEYCISDKAEAEASDDGEQ